MGNKNSVETKKNYNTSLTEREIKYLKTHVFKNIEDKITKDYISVIWEKKISETLINLFLKYYFKDDKIEMINLETFISLYDCLDTNDFDKTIKMFQTILKSNISEYAMYIESMIDSFLDVTYNHSHSYYDELYFQLELWKHFRITRNENIKNLYTKYLLSNLKTDENGIVSYENINYWLKNTHEISCFHKLIAYYMFQRYEVYEDSNHRTDIIPLPCLNDKKNDDQKTILDYYSVIFLNNNLKDEYKKFWRLLFTSRYDGPSFTKLMSSITNQGPVLVIVEDDSGHMFGAFSSANLKCSPKFTGDSNTFLFTLKPSVNTYRSSGCNENYCYLSTDGLGFGGELNDFGLWIDGDYGTGKRSTTCSTFQNFNVFLKKKEFIIKTIEIWSVLNSSPPSSEEKD